MDYKKLLKRLSHYYLEGQTGTDFSIEFYSCSKANQQHKECVIEVDGNPLNIQQKIYINIIENSYHLCFHLFLGILNILGLPVTQCPLGLSRERLPLGVQVVAGKFQDRLPLAVALYLEKSFGGWVDPGVV